MDVKPIAIYLPQFHTIPENDHAWGKGFTEWTNVKKAIPLFYGHYQPHVPHPEIGYYNLSDPDVLIHQAALAKSYGIYGFAFYHYWFNGNRLLNKPIDCMLSSKQPDFPFCFIWANENWTRRWDGKDHEVIIEQNYSEQDDIEHMSFLCDNVFCDHRYIKIDNKPVFIVYRTELFPDIHKTASLWRVIAKQKGYEDIYLIRVESMKAGVDPADINFDAAMEFSPDWRSLVKDNIQLNREGLVNLRVYDYRETVVKTLSKPQPSYAFFRSVFPSWDNTPRRSSNGTVFRSANPKAFEFYLTNTYRKSCKDKQSYIFINAWNEWGEGCHLEPDEKYGFQFLNVCKNVFKAKDNEYDINTSYIQALEDKIELLTFELKKTQKSLDDVRSEHKRVLRSPYWRFLVFMKNLISFRSS